MITKVMFSAAVALSAAVAVAIPVSADPSSFSGLSCSCEGGYSVSDGGPTVAYQMNRGIQSGLSDLLGIAV